MSEITFARLDRARIPEAAEPLVRAFDDSPIMQYLMPHPSIRRLGMRRFFRAVLEDALPFGEVWGARVDGAIAGVAVWLPPRRYPPSIRRQLRRLVAIARFAPVAPASLVRSLRFLRAVERVHPEAEHWYLATLGVDPPHQGHGLGSGLLAEVLGRADETGLPAYLETDKDRNLAYYARFRFTITDTLHPTRKGPPTWTMWREPSG